MKQPSPPVTTGQRRVLIVEDEPRLRQMLQRAIRDMEFTVDMAPTGEEAMARLKAERFDILLLDLNLPGMSGIELFERVHQQWPTIQGIVLTGYGDLEAARQAIRLNIVDFLSKPCSLAELEAALDRAMRRAAAHAAQQAEAPPSPGLFHEPPQNPGDVESPTTLHDVERQHILATLARHGGNREATATELGISVRTLYYRLNEYQKQGHYAP